MENNQKTITFRQLVLLDAIRKNERTDNAGTELAGLARIMGIELAELSVYISDLQWLLDNGFILFVDSSDRFQTQGPQSIILSESSL